MKLLLSACLLIAPVFGQSSWEWRDQVRRAHEEARRVRVEALREARSARMEAMRSAARARSEARRARDEARRLTRESFRRERIWRF